MFCAGNMGTNHSRGVFSHTRAGKHGVLLQHTLLEAADKHSHPISTVLPAMQCPCLCEWGNAQLNRGKGGLKHSQDQQVRAFARDVTQSTP